MLCWRRCGRGSARHRPWSSRCSSLHKLLVFYSQPESADGLTGQTSAEVAVSGGARSTQSVRAPSPSLSRLSPFFLARAPVHAGGRHSSGTQRGSREGSEDSTGERGTSVPHVPRLNRTNLRFCKSYCCTVLFSLFNTVPNIVSLVQSGFLPVSVCFFQNSDLRK